MDIFVVISLLGGLALFMYGMQLMSSTIKENASGALKAILEKVAGSPLKAFFLGLVVTSLIQSSKAAIVITSGLVGAGVLTYSQSLGIVVGANVGTTVTSQIFRLLDLEETGGALQLLQPSNFAPIALIIGVVLVLFIKTGKSKAIGGVITGFGILFTGLLNMTAAVDIIAGSGALEPLLGVLESNPVAGYIGGVLTAFLLQSSSASIGILQAFAATDRLTLGAVYIVILGIYLGDSITTYLVMRSDRDPDVRRVGFSHVIYTVFKSVLCFAGINISRLFTPLGSSWELPVSSGDIANLHTVFNLAAAALLLPCMKLIERTVRSVIKDSEQPRSRFSGLLEALSPSFYSVPAIALNSINDVLLTMFDLSRENLGNAYSILQEYSKKTAAAIESTENDINTLADAASSYIIDLSPHMTQEQHVGILNQYYKVVTETEHLGDHAKALSDLAGAMSAEGISFSADALGELQICRTLVDGILDTADDAFRNNNVHSAGSIDPLTDVGDELIDILKDNHMGRLSAGECTIQAGLRFYEILDIMDRIMSSCDNIGISVIVRSDPEIAGSKHEYRSSKRSGTDEDYNRTYSEAHEKMIGMLWENGSRADL